MRSGFVRRLAQLRRTAALVLLAGPPAVAAQNLAELVPMDAPHCALLQPPADAGVVVSPGGFVVVHPRGLQVTSNYTGCRVLWIADSGTRFLRFATLYFKAGKLAIAVAHEPRAQDQPVRAACALPEGRSLLRSRDKSKDGGCKGWEEDELYTLKVPSYPRQCMTAPESQGCDAPQ